LRYSSLAAVTAAVLAPGFMAYLPARPPYVAAAIAMGLLLIWRHRTNLRRLLEGTEGKIGARRSGPSSG
jgi:glycerol-3-phosphate acyltransferase PlsY